MNQPTVREAYKVIREKTPTGGTRRSYRGVRIQKLGGGFRYILRTYFPGAIVECGGGFTQEMTLKRATAEIDWHLDERGYSVINGYLVTPAYAEWHAANRGDK